METKYKIIIGSVAVVSAFAVGRYTTPVQIKTETKIIEVEKKIKDTDVDVKKNKKTTTKIITKPDGSKEETIVTETNTDKKIDQTETTDSTKNTDTKTSQTKGNSSNLTLYGIVGIDFRLNQPTYGLGIYKPILGPFGLGIFGLTNNVFGVNIGISF